MSKLKVDEIRDLTDSTTIPPAIPGLQPQLAQAWVNFDGTGVVSIRDQYNVSSITDNGTGDYTVNFTITLPNTNYCALTSARTAGTATGAMPLIYNTTNLNMQTYTPQTGALLDGEFVNIAILSN